MGAQLIVQPLTLSACSFVKLGAPSPWVNAWEQLQVTMACDLKADIDLRISFNQTGTMDLLGNNSPHQHYACVTRGKAPAGWNRGGW